MQLQNSLGASTSYTRPLFPRPSINLTFPGTFTSYKTVVLISPLVQADPSQIDFPRLALDEQLAVEESLSSWMASSRIDPPKVSIS
mmetsp:Transcript_9712/g.17682  ORF Transcript_9712/g.17682 Transcript_9712/m.17682 type:complete len:86 (+) Transcript_9712:2099-2356(+)